MSTVAHSQIQDCVLVGFACSLRDAILSGARLVSKLESHSLKFRVLDSFTRPVCRLLLVCHLYRALSVVLTFSAALSLFLLSCCFYFILYTYLLSLHVKFDSRFPSGSHPFLLLDPLAESSSSTSPCLLLFLLFVVVVVVVFRPLYFSLACLSSFLHE